MIKKATANDYDSVFPLLKQLLTKEELEYEPTKPLYLESTKENHCFVYLTDHVIGYGSLHIRTDIQSKGRVAHLMEFVIEESERGKGNGRMFLLELIEEAKKLGCVELQFPSGMPRKDAHRFYESLGFNKTAYFFWKKI